PPRHRRLRDLAAAPAHIAHLRAHELTESRTRDHPELTDPVAAAARLDRRAGLGAVAVTVLAAVDELVLDLDLSAGSRLLERDLHGHGHVAAVRTAARAASERVAAAEERVEDVAERAEALEVRAEAARGEALVAVAVVHRAALRVGQDLVCLRGLLELLLGLRVVPVHVGMEFPRKRSERLLDLALVGVPRHTEHLVGIA